MNWQETLFLPKTSYLFNQFLTFPFFKRVKKPHDLDHLLEDIVSLPKRLNIEQNKWINNIF